MRPDSCKAAGTAVYPSVLQVMDEDNKCYLVIGNVTKMYYYVVLNDISMKGKYIGSMNTREAQSWNL